FFLLTPNSLLFTSHFSVLSPSAFNLSQQSFDKFNKSLQFSTIYRTLILGGNIMTTLTVSEARAKLYGLVDAVASDHKPVTIKGKRASAVLVSENDWEAIQETLYLTSVPGMRESIKEGLATSVEECSEELDW
ncbi:MAG: type II toxin-antitoxin system Phd/YefM family antitoxin, partial [Desulfobulbaceae bacterium]|nr:type II toxin-antitoxin system Phd/YefM family antitoxin [Desulfobulbaceae bacterium]